MKFFKSLPANIKQGVSTRACSANRCVSEKNISVAGLVFGKCVCTFIHSFIHSLTHSLLAMRFNFMGFNLKKMWD